MSSRISSRIIVTGASKGIGRGIARVLAGGGCAVGLVARSVDLLNELTEELRAAGAQAYFAAADLRDRAATEAAVEELTAALGGADGLVNNAGLVIRKDVLTLSLEEWRAMVDTNIHGVFHATRAVLPHLLEQKRGHIVNISSISGYLPLAGGSGYAATKYAVTGFSESLFHEVRDHGIKVTTVFPGSVGTESHRHEGNDSWKVRPEEVGDAILQLLETRHENCVSRLEIRPLRRPKG